MPAYPASPTWIVNGAFERVSAVVDAALAAYHRICAERGLQHSYYLGFDILITGELDPSGRVVDIRPTIVDGPCCNSMPACPYIDSYRLYQRALLAGGEPDQVKSAVHPTKIQETMIAAFRKIWQAKTGETSPVMAVMTRTYDDSREETANSLMVQACRDAGLQAFRITPEENPSVSNGKLVVEGVPIDVCYRCLRAVEVPGIYGEELAEGILTGSPETEYVNPWQMDTLRPKATEEECFRAHEAAGGEPVSRPRTLIGAEATTNAVAEMFERGGYVLKQSGPTAGAGVHLHLNSERVRRTFDQLYGRYDGTHMELHPGNDMDTALAPFAGLASDSVVQQLRVIDSRSIGEGLRLAYDTRINLIFDAIEKHWTIISGFSRGVPMGQASVASHSEPRAPGNSLLTDVGAGAHMAPLIMGTTAASNTKAMTFGPLLTALNQGETAWTPP